MREKFGLLLLLVLLGVSAAVAQDDARAVALAAGKALLAGDLEEAARQFEAAREMDPELAVAWLGLAEVRELQGEPEEALAMARRAQELAPDEAVVHRSAARLLARLGADAAALEALERARELAPEVPEAYLLAGLLLRRNNKVAEAATLLAAGLDAGADTPDLRRELILLLLADGRPAEAIPVAEAAVERFPGEAGLELGLGLALAVLPERREEAPGWLEKALESGVERPERVRLELGTALLETGRAEEARPHLEAAAEAMPETPEVWYRLARARQATGDREGAGEAVERFQELSSEADAADHAGKKVGAALNEAQALAAENRLPEALSRVRELLAETPGVPRALALEAKVLYSMRRLDEALEQIRAAVEAAPGAVEYHYLEGVFLVELRRPEEAAAALRRALDIVPVLPEAWDHLGRLALQGGRIEEALTAFEKALQYGGEGEALRLFYAEALERAGRTEESREQMEAYRRLHEGGGEPGS